MSEDVLAVWLDGYPGVAGHLARLRNSEIVFVYEDDYVNRGGLQLSLSLPTAQREFDDAATRAFFDNLLPENAQLQRIMEREGLPRSDVIGLLGFLGADCAGAVSCLPVGAPPVKTPGDLAYDYAPLSDRAVARIVKSLAEEKRLPADVDDPSPVAGVQSKIALTVLPDGAFALPKHGVRVPTTHILKVPARGHGRDARLEEASALLAQGSGLEVSVPQALKIGDYEALLVTRFDRRVDNGVVTRIHQEDFAQALGFPTSLKYQRNGKPGRWFDAPTITSVLDQTQDPYGARIIFVMATLFNICIGNTDNHAKNHGLLYDAGSVPRLTPLYDLLPIRIDNRYNHNLAFQIGDATRFDDASPEDFLRFLADFGFTHDELLNLLGEVVGPMIVGLEGSARALRSMGLKGFDDLIGRETERLVELLRVTIDIRERDYFPYEKTGWGVSS